MLGCGCGCGVTLCPEDGVCAGASAVVAGGGDCGCCLSEQAEIRATTKNNNGANGFFIGANGFFIGANGFFIGANGFFLVVIGLVIIVRVI